MTLPEIERALVVTAHPDDVDFGAAGTVATMTDAGVDVSYCIVTDGDAGGFDLAMDRREMALLRRKEQTEAANQVGVDAALLPRVRRRSCAGRPCNSEPTSARSSGEVRPRVVIAQSPERILDRVYSSHPDHIATGEATLCAVYPDARNPFAFPELFAEALDPWAVDEVWVQGGGNGTHAIDVTRQSTARSLR